VTSGLAATLVDLEWRKDAAKMVVLHMVSQRTTRTRFRAVQDPSNTLTAGSFALYLCEKADGLGIGETGDRESISVGFSGFAYDTHDRNQERGSSGS
jgi:hypothetical protein